MTGWRSRQNFSGVDMAQLLRRSSRMTEVPSSNLIRSGIFFREFQRLSGPQSMSYRRRTFTPQVPSLIWPLCVERDVKLKLNPTQNFQSFFFLSDVASYLRFKFSDTLHSRANASVVPPFNDFSIFFHCTSTRIVITSLTNVMRFRGICYSWRIVGREAGVGVSRRG